MTQEQRTQEQRDFEALQAADRRAERRILIGEIALLVAIALSTLLYSRLIA